VACAGARETVEQRGVLRGIVRASEEEILPAERDVMELLLAEVVVGREAAVLQKACERRPLVQAAGRRLRQIGGGRLLRCGFDEPALQCVERRFRSFPA
jgi:hypothetical protein